MLKTLLFLILIAAISLRFFKGEELFFWNVDQDLISLVVKRIAEEGRPQLIGFPLPGGIYLGPFFYYLASFIYLLSGMNPSLIFVFSAILVAIATYLVWRVGKEIFEDEFVGMAAAVIFGFSHLANIYSRSISGLNFAPILALLLYLQLYRSLKVKRVNNLFLLVALLVISSQIEGSTLSLILLAVLIFLIFKIRIGSQQILKILIAFVIFHIPLLIFDLRHDFFLTKSILNFASRVGSAGHFNSNVFFDILSVFPSFMSRVIMISGNNDVSEQILSCSNFVSARLDAISPLLFMLTIAILGFFVLSQIFKKKFVWGEKIIFVHFILMIGGLFVYNLFLPGYVHEWVLVIFLPAICLIYGLFLSKIFKTGVLGKVLVFSFLVVFIALNIKETITSSNKYGLGNRIDAVKSALNLVGDSPYYLVSLGSCFAQGYIYLFDYFGHPPSYVEGLIFDQAYFQQGSKPDLGIILANPSENEASNYWESYNTYKIRAEASRKIGDIEVLIVEDDK